MVVYNKPYIVSDIFKLEFIKLSGIIAPEVHKRELAAGSHGLSQVMMPVNALGPHLQNLHLYVANIKKALDPNNISNPTRVIDIKAMEGETESFDEGYRYY